MRACCRETFAGSGSRGSAPALIERRRIRMRDRHWCQHRGSRGSAPALIERRDMAEDTTKEGEVMCGGSRGSAPALIERRHTAPVGVGHDHLVVVAGALPRPSLSDRGSVLGLVSAHRAPRGSRGSAPALIERRQG